MRIKPAPKDVRPVSADLFVVLMRTGLRINEALGLCGAFVYQGELDGKRTSIIHKRLVQHGLAKYHGYLCLENQPIIKSIRTAEVFTDRLSNKWQPGSVPRKPLKCRKRIDPKYFRYIPVFDAQAWNILVTRSLVADAAVANRASGDEVQNYLLFDGMTSSMFASDLAKALDRLKLRHRSTHKARHSFLTWFYSIVGEDEFLADKVAGHRDRRDIERYCHLAELMGREQKEKQKGKQRLQMVPLISA